MKNLIEKWVDHNVHITLNATVPTLVHGKLIGAEESGVLLELPNGQTFIPTCAILHISLERPK